MNNNSGIDQLTYRELIHVVKESGFTDQTMIS